MCSIYCSIFRQSFICIICWKKLQHNILYTYTEFSDNRASSLKGNTTLYTILLYFLVFIIWFIIFCFYLFHHLTALPVSAA